MRPPRNPFYLRVTHQIGSDAVFLKLYSVGMLEALPTEEMWSKMLVIRSSPGAGKTSLFRLFTPSVLSTLHSLQKNAAYQELHTRMKHLGALNNDGPRVLGALLSCIHDYPSLEDLEIDQARKDRALISLFNSRITLALLRAALSLCRLRYPDDLDGLSVTLPDDAPIPPGVPRSGSGRAYYQWACQLEQQICEAIDSLDPQTTSALPGHDTLFSLWLAGPQVLRHRDKDIAERLVVMLDDVHKLKSRQRKRLLSHITDIRAPVTVWIAERLAALSTDEILSVGSADGRETKVIYLESFWHEHHRRFEAFVEQVAEKRATWATDGQIGSITAWMEPVLDNGWHEALMSGLEDVKRRIAIRVGSNPRYFQWLRSREAEAGPLIDQLISWRALEILVERDLRRVQMSFDFDLLDEQDLKRRDEADVRTAAELFVHREFGIPYYFGVTRLASAASSNVEQFLDFAGDIFEHIASGTVLSPARTPTHVSASKQEQIIHGAVTRRWDTLTRSVASPTNVRALLDSVGSYCRHETYQDRAPYSPGVTGVAITMADRDRLRDPGYLKVRPDFTLLADVVAECISSNLLEADMDYKCKGQRWLILYLNRMLCVQFGLPLQYGGWRSRTLVELSLWISRGYRTPRAKGELL